MHFVILSRAPPSSAFNKESNWLLDITQSREQKELALKFNSVWFQRRNHDEDDSLLAVID